MSCRIIIIVVINVLFERFALAQYFGGVMVKTYWSKYQNCTSPLITGTVPYVGGNFYSLQSELIKTCESVAPIPYLIYFGGVKNGYSAWNVWGCQTISNPYYGYYFGGINSGYSNADIKCNAPTPTGTIPFVGGSSLFDIISEFRNCTILPTGLVLYTGGFYSGYSTVYGCCNCYLPVELIDFIGKCEDEKIKLSWIVSSEVELDYYKVYKSYDLIDYMPIGYVDAVNVNGVYIYSIIDNSEFEKVLYYRLSEVDINNEEHVLKTISVICEDKDDNCFSNTRVVVNQETKRLELINLPENESINIELINVTGKCLLNTNFTTSQGYVKIDLSKYQAGVYFIRLKETSCLSSYKIVLW